VVSDGSKLYMAYIRGSSDIYAGSVWWAYSTNSGVTWTDSTTPLLYGKYHSQYGPGGRQHERDTTGKLLEGFDALTMAFRNEGGSTWAYIYASYAHPSREASTSIYGMQSYITYRIRIDPAVAGGLTSDRQVLYNNPASPAGLVWKQHNGAFAWSDNDPTCWVCDTTYLPDTNYSDSTKLAPGRLRGGWEIVDPSLGVWNTASVTHNGTDFVMLLWNGNGSLAANSAIKFRVSQNGADWSAPYDVDLTYLNTDPNATPPGASHGLIPVHPAMWYGTLGGQTAYWGFFSLHWFGAYNGTRILPVKLTVPAGQMFPAAAAGNTYSVIP
jgi:hypothetical protein